MSVPVSSSSSRSPRRRCCGCCAWLFAVPVVAIVGLLLFALYRSRWTPVPIPTHAVPGPNARDDFVRAYDMLPKERHFFPISMPRVPEETYEMYALAAKDAAPALSVLRQGLTKEYGNPPQRTLHDMTTMGPWAQFRELARVLHGMARYHEIRGEYAQAADCLLDGMEMGAMVDHGGPLIARLVGAAIEAICLQPFERFLPRLSASELEHVAARMTAIEGKRTRFSAVLLEEGNTSAALLQAGFRDFDCGSLWYRAKSLWEMTRPGAYRDAAGFGAVRVYLLGDRPTIVRDELRYYRERARAAEQPYAGPIRIRLSAAGRDLEFALMLGMARRIDAARNAARSVFRTELTLLRYRTARGAFPAALRDLVPMYLGAIPDDPCGGRRLNYRLTDGGRGFLLYSLGPDLRDDGGKPQPKGPSGDEPGDIVAGKLWAKTFTPRPVRGAPVP